MSYVWHRYTLGTANQPRRHNPNVHKRSTIQIQCRWPGNPDVPDFAHVDGLCCWVIRREQNRTGPVTWVYPVQCGRGFAVEVVNKDGWSKTQETVIRVMMLVIHSAISQVAVRSLLIQDLTWGPLNQPEWNVDKEHDSRHKPCTRRQTVHENPDSKRISSHPVTVVAHTEVGVTPAFSGSKCCFMGRLHFCQRAFNVWWCAPSYFKTRCEFTAQQEPLNWTWPAWTELFCTSDKQKFIPAQ